MSAIRLPLLCAFAGGCVSSAILFGVWRAGSDASAPVVKQRAQEAAFVVPAVAAPSADAARDTASVTAESAPTGAGSAAPAAQVVDNGAPEPAGSAVSDVLMNLEAAYRARVAASAPERAPATRDRDRVAAVAPTDNDAPVTEPPPPPVAVSAVAAISSPPPVAPVAVAPVAVAPVAVAPPPVAPPAPPPIDAAPAFVAQDDPRPTEVHIGDVNQNTYITNVRQGDVYLVQMQQMQQLAMLQYMQLLGMSSGLAAPGQRVHGARPQSSPFKSTITNPDNPWGFHFSPPHLVH